MAGARVHQAGGDFAGKNLVETGLIAADAGINFSGPARLRLTDKGAVRQKRTRHRDHICAAVIQQTLRHLRLVDAVSGDQRQRHMLAQRARDPAERGARHRGGDSGNARLVPADAGIDQRGACRFDRLRQLNGLLQRIALRHQIEHRLAVDKNKMGTGRRAHRLDDRQRKAHPTGKIAAPFIAALVGARREELID